VEFLLFLLGLTLQIEFHFFTKGVNVGMIDVDDLVNVVSDAYLEICGEKIELLDECWMDVLVVVFHDALDDD
jgi:hypothetical protein